MTVTGIIAEYNPFHKGHEYHIRQARRITGADFIVVVMSGDFVQRGEPAVMDKFSRAKAALLCGADLVLELPVSYSSGSAEFFASGAVSLLDDLGCVDFLCFGSESGDLRALSQIAKFLAKEPAHYQERLKEHLKKGLSFPAARVNALTDCGFSHASSLLASPNNILAAEYIKALNRLNSTIRPVTVKRQGEYHDPSMEQPFCSATAIRKALCASSPDKVTHALPTPAAEILKECYKKTCPITPNDFSAMLHYRLLTVSSWEDLAKCCDVPVNLAQRIFRHRYDFTGFESFVALLKTRNFTELTIRRALIHILLDLPSLTNPWESMPCASRRPAKQPLDSKTSHVDRLSSSFCGYARILGFRRTASPLLRAIKEEGRLPLLSKAADARPVIQSYNTFSTEEKQAALSMLSLTIRSSQIYHSAVTGKFGAAPYQELTQKIPIL